MKTLRLLLCTLLTLPLLLLPCRAITLEPLRDGEIGIALLFLRLLGSLVGL